MTKKTPNSTTAAITKVDNSLAKFLDSQFPIPGTRWRIGADALLGLIPGIGDIIMGLISLYYIVRAFQERMKWYSILAMMWRIFLEVVLGSIPLVGDIFDIWYKANVRNNNALQKHIRERGG